ncbi:MAG: VOC family protein [Sphingomonadales bacterium]|nr:VOC family protein [Sphingomonadales bacterium]MDE2569480.1 VOC family protein [Sphingomonadales bacterium]
MFPRPKARHSQNAYVTTDLDRALAIWRDRFDVPAFHVFTNDMPGLESSHPFQLRIALANVGGTEIELIEPLNGSAPLHAGPLPSDGSFGLCFHHVAMRVEGALADFEAHMASLDPAMHPVVWTGGLADLMRFAYTDERHSLGHYVEHVWFDTEFYGQLAAAIPVYPAR